VELWKDRTHYRKSGFNIRTVSTVIAEGRARKTQVGVETNYCICPGWMITVTGRIKMCGCKRSPIIGDIWNGVKPVWNKIMEDSGGYDDKRCFKGLERWALKKGLKETRQLDLDL